MTGEGWGRLGKAGEGWGRLGKAGEGGDGGSGYSSRDLWEIPVSRELGVEAEAGGRAWENMSAPREPF